MKTQHVAEFCAITNELIQSSSVQKMARWAHHGKISCLDHSLFVAYISYRVAKKLRMDVRAASRGALLHDLYLYNSRDKSAHPGNQCIDHPKIAAENAKKLTKLSKKEENIILSHMWPLGGALPRSKEAVLVDFIDTVCAAIEFSRLYHPKKLRYRIHAVALV